MKKITIIWLPFQKSEYLLCKNSLRISISAGNRHLAESIREFRWDRRANRQRLSSIVNFPSIFIFTFLIPLVLSHSTFSISLSLSSFISHFYGQLQLTSHLSQTNSFPTILLVFAEKRIFENLPKLMKIKFSQWFSRIIFHYIKPLYWLVRWISDDLTLNIVNPDYISIKLQKDMNLKFLKQAFFPAA